MKSVLPFFLAALFALGLAIGQWQIVESRFDNNVSVLVDAANGVVTGHPHWVNYQNRILGPLLYAGIRQVTHRDDERAYQMTFVLLLWVFYCVHGACAWAMTRSANRTALVLLAAFALNALLMQPLWLYLWDAVDLTVFSVLAWAWLTRRPLWVIAAAVGVEIFNREVALILSLALLLEGVLVWRRTGRFTQMVTGLALFVGGFLVILAIRRVMLVAVALPAGATAVHQAADSAPLFWQNFCNLGRFVGRGENFIRDLPRWLVILAVVVQLVRDGLTAECRRAALWLGGVFAAVWAFGYAMEWRVWLDFMPYLTLALCVDQRNLPQGGARDENGITAPSAPSAA